MMTDIQNKTNVSVSARRLKIASLVAVLPFAVLLSAHAYGATGVLNISSTPTSDLHMGDASNVNNLHNFNSGSTVTMMGKEVYQQGRFANTYGGWSIQTSSYTTSDSVDAYRNLLGNLFGDFNSNESYASDTGVSSGIANGVYGVANKVHGSNGSFVFGAGNSVNHVYQDNSALSRIISEFGQSSMSNVSEVQNQLINAFRSGDLGSSSVSGNGNQVDYAGYTIINGFSNTVRGTESNPALYDTVIGSNNTVENANNAMVIGDGRTISSGHRTIVIGSSSKEATRTVTATDAVVLGTDAMSTTSGGVAIGSNSRATVDKGVTGWSPSSNVVDLSSPTWKSTAAAVSIGDASADQPITRQITGVAAGAEDTDAVNVAQLKQVVGAQNVENNRQMDAKFRALQNDIADLDHDIRDAGASAAALSGLKPIQYDPLQPTQVMAAVGAYRGSTAFALGLAHYTSERFLVHAGVTLDSHPMMNVGITYKFGGDKFTLDKTRYEPAADRYKAGPITASYVMQQEIEGSSERSGLLQKVKELEQTNRALVAQNAAIEARLAKLSEVVTMLEGELIHRTHKK